MSSSLLTAEVRHRMGALALEIRFELNASWTVLFGASGSGKTTMLRTIAGFVRPDAGRIVLRGVPLVDTAGGVYLRADLRPVRSAGQAARLFQGMTVQENLLYGSSAQALGDVVSIFRLGAVLGKRSHALSGGEQQRVSVARAVISALACPGALLLLDEPFGGLDLALRDAMALELQEWLAARGVPVLSVTHDVGEAFLVGAEVVRIAEGRVVDQGPVEKVLAAERERIIGQLRPGGNPPLP